jgi:hypothetical protein
MAQEFHSSILPKAEWNVFDETEPYRLLHEAICRWEWTRRLAQDTPRWLGYPDPDVLLVGDEVGPSSRGWTLPFVPYRGTSGHFLLDELRRTKLRPAIVNSQTPDGSVEAIRALWGTLGRPAVVALGKKAEDRVASSGIPYDVVHHPQWWRRFNRKTGPGAYARELEIAARG